MVNNWAEEFRKRIEDIEDRYEAAGGLDNTDNNEEECDEGEDIVEEDDLDSDENELEKSTLKNKETIAKARLAIAQNTEDLIQRLEDIQKETEKKQKKEEANAMAAMVGIILMPLLYQAISQVFQPLMQRFDNQILPANQQGMGLPLLRLSVSRE